MLGNQGSLKANRYSSSAASRNTGIDTPTIAATITAAVREPARLCSALIEPSTIDATSQMIAAGTTSDSVTGNRCANWSTTLRSSW